MPAHAIPKALESIFFVFQPITKKEYKETILKLEASPVEYLTEKYQTIEDLFGIEKPILINDFKAIAAAIKKTEKFEYYEDLGKLARKEYPETLLGHYYLGRFYEETGEPKKAMKTYQSAYILDEIGGITKDQVLELAEQIKADFGITLKHPFGYNMAKVKTTFFCQSCGTQYAKWQGQCTACKEWNTIVEELIQKPEKSDWKTPTQHQNEFQNH